MVWLFKNYNFSFNLSLKFEKYDCNLMIIQNSSCSNVKIKFAEMTFGIWNFKIIKILGCGCFVYNTIWEIVHLPFRSLYSGLVSNLISPFCFIHTRHFFTQYCNKKIKRYCDKKIKRHFSTNIFFTVWIKNIYFCLFD